MVRTPQQALAWANRQVTRPTRDWHNFCLIFSRSAYDVPSKYPTASIAYAHTEERHGAHAMPPAGAIVWWTGGTNGYGHVALSAGNGWCYSTDFERIGMVDKVLIQDITRVWNLDYKGWTEDINDVHVFDPPPAKPVLDASQVAKAARRGGKVKNGKLLKKAVADEVGPGVMRFAGNKLGKYFRRRYRKVQEKYLAATGQPVTKAAADGIPGLSSLTWLGRRHGFNVED